MKQTAIQISINNSVNNNQNGEQRMTSLEIAQLSGKQHKDVLKAIRSTLLSALEDRVLVHRHKV